MNVAGRDALARSVTSFLQRVCSDPVARRALRSRPQDALRENGFAAPTINSELPIRHHQVSVALDAPALFGWATVPPKIDPPLELTLVSIGAKPLALLCSDEDRAAGMVRWAEARRLPAMLGPFEFDVASEAGKRSFFDLALARRPARPGSGAWRHVLVGESGNANDVALAWLALLFDWDAVLGTLLGYPSCCVEAFADRWSNATSNHNGDVAALSLTGGPWELNVAARFVVPTLVHHFPCQPDCEPSLQLARRHLTILRTLAPDAVKRMEQVLAAPLIHAGTEGLVVLVDAVVDADGSVSYDPDRALSSADTFTTRQVFASKRLSETTLPEGSRLVTFMRGQDALVCAT